MENNPAWILNPIDYAEKQKQNTHAHRYLRANNNQYLKAKEKHSMKLGVGNNTTFNRVRTENEL